MEEEVLVVPADVLFIDGEWFGFTTRMRSFHAILDAPHTLEYRPRRIVETDPSVKQLIPYAILKRGDEVFVYRRGKAGGEDRLHDRWSIGVGGHISKEDGDAGVKAYEAGFLRELDEEVEIKGEYHHRIVGLLYDPRTPVGSVHVGVVHLVETSGEVVGRDPSLADPGFKPLSEIARDFDRLETWSQFVIEPLSAGRL
jgi:predicted NUDIX family phosphoesterase